MMADVKKEVEAILFSAGRVVKLKELQALLGLKNPGLITEAIKELMQEYVERESPTMIVEEDEGYKLAVKERFLPIVQKINPHTELSKSMLETLAVITWKQPILQADVIKIRTNKAYDHIAELERLGFIAKEKFGRSFKIKVTQKFLDYFDLPNTEAIKEVFKDFRDVEVAVKKKADKIEKAAEEAGPAEAAATAAESEKDGSDASIDPESGLPVDESGALEFEPYIDVLPEDKKPKRDDAVEVYESTPEEVKEEQEEEKAEEEAEKEEEAHEAQAESTEEKARRLARELLEEKESEASEETDSEPSRRLHPKLEEFIAKHAEEVTPKPTEEHEVEHAEEESAEPEEGEGRPEEKEAENKSEDAGGDSLPDHDDDEPLPAEEYPGQFKEQAEEEPAEQPVKKKASAKKE
ncbi:SMC-Scp complex subunit ScpB [Candidatus Woesearchaeota archaeon]|nr:SMC-Scp complex subunit ScpB [Candidatus Woesearchaeota archaeon]